MGGIYLESCDSVEFYRNLLGGRIMLFIYLFVCPLCRLDLHFSKYAQSDLDS